MKQETDHSTKFFVGFAATALIILLLVYIIISVILPKLPNDSTQNRSRETAQGSLPIGSKPAGSSDTSASPNTIKASEELTFADYEKIKPGMTYSEVVGIIGPGKELSSGEMAGTVNTMYVWQNPGGANMNALFQSDKLIQKAQFGLK